MKQNRSTNSIKGMKKRQWKLRRAETKGATKDRNYRNVKQGGEKKSKKKKKNIKRNSPPKKRSKYERNNKKTQTRSPNKKNKRIERNQTNHIFFLSDIHNFSSLPSCIALPPFRCLLELCYPSNRHRRKEQKNQTVTQTPVNAGFCRYECPKKWRESANELMEELMIEGQKTRDKNAIKEGDNARGEKESEQRRGVKKKMDGKRWKYRKMLKWRRLREEDKGIWHWNDG